MVRYNKITKGQAHKVIIDHSNSLCGFFPISANYVKDELDTSYYQANKFLKILQTEGKIKYISRVICDYDYEHDVCYCDYHLPVWGYVLEEQI